jgi:hypothetical protein
MYRIVEVINSFCTKTVDTHEVESFAIAMARDHNFRTGTMVEILDDFGKCIRRIQTVDDRTY